MKPPRTVTIGPTVYTIELSDHIEQFGDSNGMVDPEHQAIYLHKNLAEDTRRVALWHEIKHAAWFEVGLREYLDDLPSEKREEAVVAGLSPRELDILRRNPKLVAYLVAP